MSLSSEGYIFVSVFFRLKACSRGLLSLAEENCPGGSEIGWIAITRDADASDEVSAFIQRYSARRIIQRCQGKEGSAYTW